MDKMTTKQWSEKYDIQPDDPMYGAVLAVKESRQSAAQAAEILQEIRDAIAQIPVAAEQSPKIISAIRTLSSDMEKLTRESQKLLSEQKSLVETYDWKTDAMLNAVRLQEPREREERIQAIAKSVMARVDTNLLKSSTLENWRFGVTVVGLVLVFILGTLLSYYHFRADHRLLPYGTEITTCHSMNSHSAVCTIVPRPHQPL